MIYTNITNQQVIFRRCCALIRGHLESCSSHKGNLYVIFSNININWLQYMMIYTREIILYFISNLTVYSYLPKPFAKMRQYE